MTDSEKIRIKALELAIGLLNTVKASGISIKGENPETIKDSASAKLLVDGTIIIGKEFEEFITASPDGPHE